MRTFCVRILYSHCCWKGVGLPATTSHSDSCFHKNSNTESTLSSIPTPRLCQASLLFPARSSHESNNDSPQKNAGKEKNPGSPRIVDPIHFEVRHDGPPQMLMSWWTGHHQLVAPLFKVCDNYHSTLLSSLAREDKSLARIVLWYYRTYLDKQRLKTGVKSAVTDEEAVTFGQKFISGGSIFPSPLQQTLSSAPGLGFARSALLVKALQI